MKLRFTQLIIAPLATAALLLPLLTGAAAHAITSPVYPTDSTAAAPKTDTADSKRLAAIKTKGDAELARRLATLNKLLATINAAPKLTQASKISLVNEVTDEITAITNLRTKLAAETTVASAAADVSDMITEYRVYAFIMPKVQLIKAADDQQVVEQKLSSLSDKLTTRLQAAKNKGKDITGLQLKLDDMKQHVTSAQDISTTVESKVLPLLPSDYDHDHSVLSTCRDNLKTAHDDNQIAYADARAIVNDVKNL